MKRDCGSGTLVPKRWRVVYVRGQSDQEHEKVHNTQSSAQAECDQLVAQLVKVAGSNVRLYVEDNQGYANCLWYWSQACGVVTDRRNEV